MLGEMNQDQKHEDYRLRVDRLIKNINQGPRYPVAI